MFNVPKNAIYKRISRRKFLELGGGVATALGAGTIAVGLNSTIMRTPVQAASSPEAKMKQYAGSKLVFMSENTPPSFAIRDKIKEFYDATGITVEILTDDLPVVQQKVGIDMKSGKSDFPLIYSQDKPIGAPLPITLPTLINSSRTTRSRRIRKVTARMSGSTTSLMRAAICITVKSSSRSPMTRL